MKFQAFLHKLFPCMKNTTSSPPHPSQPPLQHHFEDQLNNERQKRLEESRLLDLQLENDRLANEEFQRILHEAENRKQQEREAAEQLQHQKESAERLASIIAKEQEELERALAEDLQKQQQEAERLRLEGIVDTIFRQYMEKFHEFFSSRPQPIHSNFNEKMFKDLCNTFNFNTEDELLSCLDKYNLLQKQDKEAYNQLSRKRKIKCDVFNFYLFIDCNHHKN